MHTRGKVHRDLKPENILLFFLFYEALLKTCLKINIDMTMPKLDQYYSCYKMKYNLKLVDVKSVLQNINQTFLKGILVNYLMLMLQLFLWIKRVYPL